MPQFTLPISRFRSQLTFLSHLFIDSILIIASIALVRDTLENGHDFTVFWKGARAVLDDQNLYSLSRDGGMVFKYPPWILPIFFPLGLLPLRVAKLVWGILEVLSLASVVQWLRLRAQCSQATLWGVLLAFWGLWAVHALDGQIALMMLAGALWAWTPDVFEKSKVRSFILVFGLSTKIFTLFPLLQNRISKKLLKRSLGIAGILLLLTLPAAWTQHSANRPNFISLLSDWKQAATSGGSLLTAEQVRGRYNPGLTGLVLRLIQVPVNQPGADVMAACILGLMVAFSWKRASQRMHPLEAWVGWLGLTPVIHPLPWWHLFVFSFPLAVVCLDRTWQSPGFGNSKTPEGTASKAMALLGVGLICASTEKLLGPLGLFLELACAKSWGVLICASVLVYETKKRPPASTF